LYGTYLGGLQQYLFRAHRKVDRRLIHIYDEAQVTMRANEERAYEVHVVLGVVHLICYPLRVFSGDRYKVSNAGFKITNYYKRNSETT
jgi:hypothetical protein